MKLLKKKTLKKTHKTTEGIDYIYLRTNSFELIKTGNVRNLKTLLCYAAITPPLCLRKIQATLNSPEL